MTNVTVVVGAQFGSEGKGAISAHLCKNMTADDVAVRVAGPNAGHTAYDGAGREWKLRAVPVAAVVSPNCRLHIAAGSEVDPQVLLNEIYALEEAGHEIESRLTVHPHATALLPENLAEEQANGIVGRIGSTGKGIGSARAGRIMRVQPTWGEFVRQTTKNAGERWWERTLGQATLFDLDDCGDVLIEGTQGYGLGLHTRFYPQVTSSDCRAIDFLAMTGISPWDGRLSGLDIQLVARMYPIRVAGNSGPLRGETTWGELGLEEERTTVTNKVRRVGAWDEDLVLEAIKANGGPSTTDDVYLALTMLDQRFPSQADRTDLDDVPLNFVEDLGERLNIEINLVGTGPKTVVEL